jgi:hypothetical protein
MLGRGHGESEQKGRHGKDCVGRERRTCASDGPERRPEEAAHGVCREDAAHAQVFLSRPSLERAERHREHRPPEPRPMTNRLRK